MLAGEIMIMRVSQDVALIWRSEQHCQVSALAKADAQIKKTVIDGERAC
jgi:hypothetical protein